MDQIEDVKQLPVLAWKCKSMAPACGSSCPDSTKALKPGLKHL